MLPFYLFIWKLEFWLLFGWIPNAEMTRVRPESLGKVYDHTIQKERFAYGQCHPFSNLIRLNQKYIEQATYYQLRSLIWHEWGHCELNLDDEEGWGYTLMNRSEDVIRPDGGNVEELKSELYWRWVKSGRGELNAD